MSELPSDRDRRVTNRVALVGGTVVTMNRAQEVFFGDVVFEGDRIVTVGPGAAKSGTFDEVVDCRGRIVLPGFVQPHIHLCQTLLRGRADGLELLDWLKTRVWPFEAQHTFHTLYVSALVGAYELLRSGTTAILDMGTVRHTDAVFEACRVAGLRATVGKAMMDLDEGQPAALFESTDEALMESRALFERWHGREHGRLRYAFSPRFALSCSHSLLLRSAAMARDCGVLLHTHASENRAEIALVRQRANLENIEYLASVGYSGADTVLAHCVHLSDVERRLLAESGTHVAHCPSSNLKLGSGIADIPALLAAGVNVGLGADGAPCANNLDVFMEMRLAGLIHNVRSGPTALSPRQVVALATVGGAKALGLDDQVGRLEPGKKADIVVVNARRLHTAPAEDPFSVLVYASRADDVEHVVVDGCWRVRSHTLVDVELDALLAEAAAIAAHGDEPIGP